MHAEEEQKETSSRASTPSECSKMSSPRHGLSRFPDIGAFL